MGDAPGPRAREGPAAATRHATRPAAAGAPEASTATSGLAHLPGLDGLRGVAIAGTLLYHGGLARGAWLGISTFFTLSGFLITGLLVTEHHRTGTVGLGGFWSRRLRRLAPAALVAIALTAVLAWWAGWVTASTRGDLLAAAGWVANWRFVLEDRSYGDLFADPSPVQHVWSLAVEEQFYLVFPLLVLLAARGGRRGVAVAMALVAVTSALAPVLGGYAFDRAYYGTDARAGEFAVGALLALALWRPDRPGLLRPRGRAARAVERVAPVALVAGALAWWRVAPRDGWVEGGWMPVYAALVVAPVLAASTLMVGPVASLMAWRPLRWLGSVSYGVYLYHWPLFLLLDEDRTGLDGWALFGVQAAASVAVAAASYHLLEIPVRRGRRLRRPERARAGWLGATAVAVAVVLVATASPPPPPIDFEAAQEEVRAAVTATATSLAPRAPSVALFGDSTAVTAALGILAWSVETGEAVTVPGATELGCGLAFGGERRSGVEEGAYPVECPRWDTEWLDVVTDHDPDVVLVMFGGWDAWDRRLPEWDGWYHAGDEVFDTWWQDQVRHAFHALTAHGAHVVWATIPPVAAAGGGDAVAERGETADPARVARLNELVEQVAEERPGQVSILDWAGWLASTGDDRELRPDGVHLSRDSTHRAAAWIMPEVIELWRAVDADDGPAG